MKYEPIEEEKADPVTQIYRSSVKERNWRENTETKHHAQT